MVSTPDFDPEVVHAELERVRADFHDLLGAADAEALARRTDGTRWTNEELLFHMLFGYLIVRSLLPLVRLFSRLPARVGRSYSRLLDVATWPFDQANYFGSVAGSRVFDHRRMAAKMDRTVAALHRSLDRETEQSLNAAMHFPARWDPFFRATMTVGEVYRYATQHYDFHHNQLTLGD
ncbi:DinB family protein [Streptacidiphilus pinicola]|uniref:DinB family protein n=1 Tax=Streptacidiphilus pinicola TaxID=2219663 RepID=A0A2X0IPC0_9ACTN|nr:DinB family protein [Streptacidiphilus pinicola]RAG87044.1 DinB family protein [Streptacidiphilus pinicola]